MKYGLPRYCKCGCGSNAPRIHDASGRFKGYLKFVVGHRVFKKWTQEEKEIVSGTGSSNWGGGRNIQPNGYIRVWVGAGNGTLGTRKQYEYEHRVVASKALGRPLKNNEHVHHINMIKVDNRNKNLLICTREYHLWLEHEYARIFAKEFFGALCQQAAVVVGA